MTARQFCTALTVALAIHSGMAFEASATILTYQFSGTYPQFGPPAADLVPDFQNGDPFSGTFTFDDSAPGVNSYPGQPLSITMLFDNTYSVTWSSGAFRNEILRDVGMNDVLFIKSDPVGVPADFNDVYATGLNVNFFFTAGNVPASLPDFDPTSPNLAFANVGVHLRGTSLFPGDMGAEKEIFFNPDITSVSLVPEPSSLVLAGAALVGLAALVRRRLSSNTHAKYGAR